MSLIKGEFMLFKEAKEILKENGFMLETRRPGMQRQVFKETNDFEAFMNDNKIKSLYNSAVKAKKNSDKELIADGNDPDEYDAIWNDIDESYYDKLVNAVNGYFGEAMILIYHFPAEIVVETENNSYTFDLSAGQWDNVDLGKYRQDPDEFFKTIYKIATEK